MLLSDQFGKEIPWDVMVKAVDALKAQKVPPIKTKNGGEYYVAYTEPTMTHKKIIPAGIKTGG
jgi:hypothetical protein